MATLIYLLSAFIAVAATILAVSAPRVLAERYKRWITPIYYVVIAGVAWIFVSGSSSLTAINAFAEDRSISPESALHTIRMFASEAVSQRRTNAPALMTLLIAAIYVQLLGRNRRRSLNATPSN